MVSTQFWVPTILFGLKFQSKKVDVWYLIYASRWKCVFAIECLLIIMRLWGFYRHTCFKYDSVHGKAKQYDVKADAENSLLLGGKPIAVYGLKYVCEFGTLKFLEGNFIQLDQHHI